MSNYRSYIIDKLNELHIAPQSANMVFFWKPYPSHHAPLTNHAAASGG